MTSAGNKPAIVAVDDDPQVLRALAADLRSRYRDRHRVVSAAGGAEAVDVLDELARRGDPVALAVSDQRMPDVDGLEVLSRLRSVHPDAKAVLLTAYADTDVAIRAINEIGLDFYVTKPWEPVDDRLYPVVDDLLDAWWAGYRPRWSGLRVTGNRWHPDVHRIREFLHRNQVPYEWLDGELNEAAAAVRTAAGNGVGADEAAVLLPDGRVLVDPTNAELADAVGLRTQASSSSYDLVVIGGGPAGLAAGIYGATEGLSTAVVERDAPGGQAGQSSRIENYLGFPVGLSGADLARRAVAQASRFGVELLAPVRVDRLEIDGNYRVVVCEGGQELVTQAVVLATGVSYRRLEAPGVDDLTGRGVYYGAATTEAVGRDEDEVVVIGGANSAGQAAVFLSSRVRKVTMLVRSPDGLAKSMSNYLIGQIDELPNIDVRAGWEVASVSGDGHLEGVTVSERASGSTEDLPASAMFVFIGARPSTEWLGVELAKDERGYLCTGLQVPEPVWLPGGASRDRFITETSVPGVFAVGDVRAGSVKRVASAVGEGSITVQFVHQYLALGAPVG